MPEEISVWKKFFSPKEEVLKHWYTPVDDFQFLSSDFYQMIERELGAREVPGLEIARIEFNEGGMLSMKREYLRLKRERLVFDICAAPFGKGYFFSFRFVELPLGIKLWQLFAFFIGILLLLSLCVKLFGFILGVLAMIVVVGAGFYLMRNALALGFKDLDRDLLQIPVLGAIYEVFFRKETYYREDTRLMYLSTVNGITEALVNEVTAAKGIKIVKRFERTPVFGELYREKQSSRDRANEPPPTAVL